MVDEHNRAVTLRRIACGATAPALAKPEKKKQRDADGARGDSDDENDDELARIRAQRKRELMMQTIAPMFGEVRMICSSHSELHYAAAMCTGRSVMESFVRVWPSHVI